MQCPFPGALATSIGMLRAHGDAHVNNADANRTQTGKARLILVGGFFGAGKTTAISRLGSMLKRTGRKVAIVTLAAGGESVDTLRLRALGFEVEEVSRLSSIIQTTEELRHRTAAEIVLVELPGGFSHLPAPAQNDPLSVTPLSIVINTLRAAEIFGLESPSPFSEDVTSLYQEQIAQGSILVLNKAGSLGAKKMDSVRQVLQQQNREARILELKEDDDLELEKWRDLLHPTTNETPRPRFNRDAATRAEQAFGSLNCVVNLSTVKYFEGDRVMLDLATVTQNLLRQESAEIAHLKMILQPTDGTTGHTGASVSSNQHSPDVWESLPEPIKAGRMVLNLRAECDPGLLHSVTNRALLAVVEKSPELFARLESCEHFRTQNAAA